MIKLFNSFHYQLYSTFDGEVKIMSNSQCINSKWSQLGINFDSKICVVNQGKDTCQGTDF